MHITKISFFSSNSNCNWEHNFHKINNRKLTWRKGFPNSNRKLSKTPKNLITASRISSLDKILITWCLWCLKGKIQIFCRVPQIKFLRINSEYHHKLNWTTYHLSLCQKMSLVSWKLEALQMSPCQHREEKLLRNILRKYIRCYHLKRTIRCVIYHLRSPKDSNLTAAKTKSAPDSFRRSLLMTQQLSLNEVNF